MSTGNNQVVFQPAIPQFRIFDEAVAKRFYLDYLGFQLDFEHRFHETAPLFCQISRGALVIHLTEHYGGVSPGALTTVSTNDVRAYLEELRSRAIPNLNPDIEEAPWGALLLKIYDPFHNTIVFSQQL